MKWTQEEDDLLVKLKEINPEAPMSNLKEYFKQRTVPSLYKRWDIINPSFSKGRWNLDEKTMLFEKMFEVLSANIDTISQSLGVQRHKKDISKQVYKVKEIAAAGYLGSDYKISNVRVKPESKRECKTSVKSHSNKLKFEDTYDAIDSIQHIQRASKKRLVKEEHKTVHKNSNADYSKRQISHKFADLPCGLTRQQFLVKLEVLQPKDPDDWSFQEDQNLLQLYQELGSAWHSISLSTDYKSTAQVKQRFSNLLLWGAYHYKQPISVESPLESTETVITNCVELLLEELSAQKKTQRVIGKVKFESGANISESDNSNDSEFSY